MYNFYLLNKITYWRFHILAQDNNKTLRLTNRDKLPSNIRKMLIDECMAELKYVYNIIVSRSHFSIQMPYLLYKGRLPEDAQEFGLTPDDDGNHPFSLGGKRGLLISLAKPKRSSAPKRSNKKSCSRSSKRKSRSRSSKRISKRS